MDVAAAAEDPSFEGCGGCSRREMVVIVEMMKVSSSVFECGRYWWSRSLE